MPQRTSPPAAVIGRGWVAIAAALTGLTMCPLLGCGGRAVDGDKPAQDDDVRLEALPQRLLDCDALRAYTSGRAEEMLALAPTGNPLQPLYEPGGSAGFEQSGYAEWPEATREPGGGRMAHARRAGSSADEFYLVTNDAVPSVSISPSQNGGSEFRMPAALHEGRDRDAPAWIFADGARVLIVGNLAIDQELRCPIARRATLGKLGRYMSIESGPSPASAPSTSVRRSRWGCGGVAAGRN